MKKILVTGANGMLGQDLCPILTENGFDVIKTDVDNMDITDIDSVKRALEEYKPEVVIHCAAYTNVDKAEEDYETAHKINVIGTENLAKVCAENDITVVYISTDYVFAGKNNNEELTPYRPNDNPNPINNYGLTKFQGEEAIRKFCRKYYIARTSWLYGIHGKNFVETMISLADKPELKVVDDQVGCPTWTVELSKGILKLLSGKAYGTHHVCGSGSTSWYGFAKAIFEKSGLRVNLLPCTTEEFPRSAKRPKYSVLANASICRPWQDALEDYLSIRNKLR